MTRHMFAGANTPKGFVNYFGNIPNITENQRTIYLKGPSGSGKSSFIRKVGVAFENDGYDAEYFHCSNDAGSIDGLCIPAFGISLIDATSPHVCDPVMPGVNGEIIDLTEFLNNELLSEKKNELTKLLGEKKRYYATAYNYLNAAFLVKESNRLLFERVIKKERLNAKIIEMCGLIKKPRRKIKSAAINRKLFASAVTPDGLVNFTDETITRDVKKIYKLHEEGGFGADVILTDVLRTTELYGCNVETFWCPMNPDRLEHFIIPDVGVCFTTANEYHETSLKATKDVWLDDFVCSRTIGRYASEIACNKSSYNELLNKAIDFKHKARIVHENIEEIYGRGMDFKRLDVLTVKTISRLKTGGYITWTK